jgi:hypothetical protein
MHNRAVMALLIVPMLLCGARPLAGVAQTTERVMIRGQSQTLRLSGPPDGEPVIVSSGDGGWMHLGPHVAQVLSASGYFVVGFDTKAYLESFTAGSQRLQTDQVAPDYRVLTAFATGRTGKKPTLIGVSEGAGLSVLAATDPHTKAVIAGVLGLGLPDVNELGWRWRDALIYLTHGVPNEPTFSVAAIIGHVAPLPIGAIHSTHDEFVPLTQVQRLMQGAGEPKKLWIVGASDHRFSDNLTEFDRRLLEAVAWVKQNAPR